MKVGECRGRAQGDRRLESLARGGTVVLDQADREAAESQRHGIIASMDDGGMGVADGSLAVLFPSACPHEQDLVAKGSVPVRKGVVGFAGGRLLQQQQRL
jgi:hypothetical protein